MSMPALYKNGGNFLSFPARQAAKVLGRKHREYIVRTLMKVAMKVPAVMNAVQAIQTADYIERDESSSIAIVA